MIENRRIKLVCVRPGQVLSAFDPSILDSEDVPVSFFLDLPEDYEVHGVNFDPMRQAFLFTVAHSDFPVLKDGQEAEVISSRIRTRLRPPGPPGGGDIT